MWRPEHMGDEAQQEKEDQEEIEDDRDEDGVHSEEEVGDEYYEGEHSRKRAVTGDKRAANREEVNRIKSLKESERTAQ